MKSALCVVALVSAVLMLPPLLQGDRAFPMLGMPNGTGMGLIHCNSMYYEVAETPLVPLADLVPAIHYKSSWTVRAGAVFAFWSSLLLLSCALLLSMRLWRSDESTTEREGERAGRA